MASKSTLILLGVVLLFTSKVSSNDEELMMKVNSAVVPTPVPPTHPPPRVGTVPHPAPSVAPVPAPVPVPVPAPIVRSNKDCVPLCDNRCQLHSRKRVCMRACSTCCERCKCVPPGTSGNRELCGKCYTDMITHGNRYKCP